MKHYLLKIRGSTRSVVGGVPACKAAEKDVDSSDPGNWQTFPGDRCTNCEGYLNLQALKADGKPRRHEWVPIHKAYQCKFCPAIYPDGEPCRGLRR